jgi:probable HAF family extracellular repeat protein
MGSAIGAGINDGGAVVAFEVYPGCNIPCPDAGAYLDIGGTVSALADASLFFAAPLAINTGGQVVGWGEDDNGYDHGFLFANGAATDLGQNTQAFSINTSGVIVGAQKVGLYDDIGPGVDGFAYSAGVMQSLNIPGAYAAGINDSGWIIADNPTLGRAYLLSPSAVSVAPTGLSFGAAVIGATASSSTCGTCAVTITNGTASTQPLGAPTLIGPFALAGSHCPNSLAAGASCTFSLNFRPTGPDTNVGEVSVAIGGTVYATLLTGVGTNTVSLTSSSATVAVGVPFTLSWTGTPGATCSASGGALAPNNAPLDAWTGTKPSSGILTLSEAAPAALDFTLTCTDGTQTATAHAPVTVAAPVAHLSASGMSATAGQMITLTWSSSDATGCVASGGAAGDGWAGAKPSSGSAMVTASLAAFVTYTLICSSGSATAKASAVVRFDAPSGGGGGGLSVGLLAALAALVLRRGWESATAPL